MVPPNVGLLQSVADSTHLDTCTVREPVETFDETGAIVTTYEDVPGLVDIPCRVGPPQSPVEVIAGGRIVRRAYRQVAFEVGTTINARNRILVNGMVLEVIGSGPSTYEAERQVLCEEIQ